MKRLSEVVPLAEMFADMTRRRAAWRAETVAKHGWPDDVRCLWCGDTGKPVESTTPFCTCEAGRAERDRLDFVRRIDAAIPKRMRDWTLATARDVRAARAVHDWYIADPMRTGQNLILRGPTGTGKTGLALGVLRHLAHDTSIAFHVTADLMDLFRPDAASGANPDAVMAKVRRVGALVLDDLGAERPSEFVAERMYTILNDRLNASRPTIVTTNFSDDGLRDLYGDRIMRRLTQDGTARVVTVIGHVRNTTQRAV